jgi:hypothetical protein
VRSATGSALLFSSSAQGAEAAKPEFGISEGRSRRGSISTWIVFDLPSEVNLDGKIFVRRQSPATPGDYSCERGGPRSREDTLAPSSIIPAGAESSTRLSCPKGRSKNVAGLHPGKYLTVRDPGNPRGDGTAGVGNS